MNRARQHARAGGIAVFLACLGAGGFGWADSAAESKLGSVARDDSPSPTASQIVSADFGVDEVTANADSGDAREAAADSAATSVEVSDAWIQHNDSGVNYGAEDPLADISLLSLAAKLGLGLVVVVLLAWAAHR